MTGHALTGLADPGSSCVDRLLPAARAAHRGRGGHAPRDRSSSSAASCPTGATRAASMPSTHGRTGGPGFRTSPSRSITPRRRRGAAGSWSSAATGPIAAVCAPPSSTTAARGAGSRRRPRSEPRQPRRRRPTDVCGSSEAARATASRRGPLARPEDAALEARPGAASARAPRRDGARRPRLRDRRSAGRLRHQPADGRGLRSAQESLGEPPRPAGCPRRNGRRGDRGTHRLRRRRVARRDERHGLVPRATGRRSGCGFPTSPRPVTASGWLRSEVVSG